MRFLSSEIDADIDLDIAEVIVGLELRFFIVIGVEHPISAEIPFGVVPYQAQSPHPVEVDVVEREILEEQQILADAAR